MDKELKAIVEIEKHLEGLSFEAKHRVADYVKARIKYDPLAGTTTTSLVGGTFNQSAQKSRP